MYIYLFIFFYKKNTQGASRHLNLAVELCWEGSAISWANLSSSYIIRTNDGFVFEQI